MKKRNVLVCAAALVVALVVLAGCDAGMGNMLDITDGYGAVALQIQGSRVSGAGPSAAVAAVRAPGDPLELPVSDAAGVAIGTIVLSDARVVLENIEIEQDDAEIDTVEENEQELEIEYEGPFVVDLVAESIVPELPIVEMIPGTYTNIKVELHSIEGDEDDETGQDLVADTDPLFGNSIYLAGTYSGETGGGTVTDVPFSLSFDLDEEFELTAAGDTSVGFVVDEGLLNPIIIAFRLAKWFAFDDPETNDSGIDFSSVVLNADSEIVLDGNQTGDNEEIRAVIKDNIKMSADYGEDDDGSGELESDEDDDSDDDNNPADGEPDDDSPDDEDSEVDDSGI